jgi:hypothetical protein
MSTFVSLLLAASITGQGTDRLVSAQVRAASGPVAIADLARQIDYPLEAMPSTKNDILIISVNKVPIKTLMEQIAKASSGVWEQTLTGFRLIHNDSSVREEKAIEQARLTKLITDTQAAMRKAYAGQGELTDQKADIAATRLTAMSQRMNGVMQITDWREQQKVQKQAPVYRVMQQIIPQIDAATLASVPRNRTYVFSTAPNRMQGKLPGNVGPYLQKFIAEQKIWSRAMKAAQARQGGNNYYSFDAQDPGVNPVGKVLLKLSRQGQGQNIQVNLLIVDTKGRQMANGNDNLGFNWDSMDQESKAAAKAGESEESIKLSGISKQISDTLSEAFKKMQGGNTTPEFNLSPEVREIMINVDQHEPLSYLASDAMFEVGRIKKLNVVACPTDEMLVVMNYSGSKDIKPANVLGMANGYQADVESKDGWLTIKPRESSYVREHRLSRQALANYLRSAAKEGRVSLDIKAAFALNSNIEQDNFLPMFFVQMLGLTEGNSYDGDWDTIKLYGTLTANQTRSSKLGQPIPFRSLQPNQIEIIRHMIFDRPYGNLQVTWTQEDMTDAGEDGVFYGGLNQEPTEVLPNGFTGAEMLTVVDSSEAKVFGQPERDGQNGMMWGEQPMNADSLANEMFQAERPEFFPWRNQPGFTRPAMTKFRLGNERTINFSAQLTRKASFMAAVNDRMYKSRETYSFDKLPNDFKKQVQDSLVRLREAYKNQKPPTWNPGIGPGNGNIPPRTIP